MPSKSHPPSHAAVTVTRSEASHQSRVWFDGHLDLACLAVTGRDMMLVPSEVSGPEPPASVTLPSLKDGNVRMALATIFTEPDGSDACGYPAGNAERAFAVGRAQLEVYRTWSDRGLASLRLARDLMSENGVGQIRGGMGVSEVVPMPLEKRRALMRRSGMPAPPLQLSILIEGADPIRSPDDAIWWRDQGVAAVGMAWWKSSRYAGGNGADSSLAESGITDLGQALVRELDRLDIVHDVSHLSDRALRDLLEMTDRPLVASHSNCRALMGGGGFGENQRHLTDEAIIEIGRRKGMIGLNLYSRFLAPAAEADRRAGIHDCIAHITRMCDLHQGRDHVGLGSDMDGGFSAARLPEGINLPVHLMLLADALVKARWTDSEIDSFCWKNWAKFWTHPTDPNQRARD